jgi:flagellar biosynthesis/type III secretory pathway protein FliH
VQDERILELQRNVKSVQENAEVGVRYMQLWEEMAMSRQDGYDEGREAGYDEGKEAGYGEGRKAGHQEGYGEGREAGYGEGREAGYDEGCAKINALAQKLLSDNRMDDFWRATKDLAYQEQLLKEYRL